MRFSGLALKLLLYSCGLALLLVAMPRPAAASDLCTALDPPFCAENFDTSMSTVDAGGGIFIGSTADGFGSTLPWSGTPTFTSVIIAFPDITFSGAATLTPGLVNAGTSACSGSTYSPGTCPSDPSTDQILFTGCTLSVTSTTTGAQFDCALTTAESNEILGWLNGSDNAGSHSIWPLIEGSVTITTPSGLTQNAIVLMTPTPTPEPSSLMLLIGGISTVGWPLRRKIRPVVSRWSN